MWTRAFIWTGVASGVILAALVLALMMLTLNFAFGKIPPYGPYSNFGTILTPGVLALIVYPICWRLFIVSQRNYSAPQTWVLVFAAYVVTCVAASLIILVAGLAAAFIVPFNNGGSLVLLMFWPAPLVTGVVLLPLYILIAAPIAFFHRFGLLALFGRQRNI